MSIESTLERIACSLEVLAGRVSAVPEEAEPAPVAEAESAPAPEAELQWVNEGAAAEAEQAAKAEAEPAPVAEAPEAVYATAADVRKHLKDEGYIGTPAQVSRMKEALAQFGKSKLGELIPEELADFVREYDALSAYAEGKAS